MYFPTVSGTSLAGREFTLPFSLDGEFNIVILAFEPVHQLLLQSWLPSLENLRLKYERLAYYQLPTLWAYSDEQRHIIDIGMRQAIPNPRLHDRVIPLYVQKDQLREVLELPNESTIYILLIDREGEILWRADGVITPEKLESLTRLLDQVHDRDNEPS